MTEIIAFINQKGGVGKTTLSANCSAYWAKSGRKVLALDVDPQANLSLHLGASTEQLTERNLYLALREDITFEEAIIELPEEGLDLIGSHIDMSAAEWEFSQEVAREVILREKLADLLEKRHYDLIIVDCPPSLGFLSLNALTAASSVVIPVQTEFFALQGMSQLLRVLKMVRARLNTNLGSSIIVPTLVDPRTNLAREVIAELETHFSSWVTKNWISKRVKVAEAPSFGQSIFLYAGDSPAAAEFEALSTELEERLGLESLEDLAKASGGSEQEVQKNEEASDSSAEVATAESTESEEAEAANDSAVGGRIEVSFQAAESKPVTAPHEQEDLAQGQVESHRSNEAEKTQGPAS